MGIKLYDAELLLKQLPVFGPAIAEKRLLTLGVQDCYFRLEDVTAFLKKQGFEPRPLAPQDILPTTGMGWASPEYRKGLIHQKTFFGLLGFSPDNVKSMDGSDYEQPDWVHDLNVPVEKALAGQFDMVFDGGTLEHVFSLKDAFFNMARLVRPGGLAIHHAPFDWPDHGFVNFNPTLLRDFYLSNGFEELAIQFTAVSLKNENDYFHMPIDQFKHFLRPEFGLLLFGVYRKIREQELVIPTQGIYKKIWKQSKK